MLGSKFILPIFLLLVVISCKSDEEKELLAKIRNELAVTKSDSVSNFSGSVDQYKEMELQMNQAYIQELKEQPAKSFEKQLQAFEDNELGIIKSYINMFNYLILSKEHWDDDMIVKSNKYFNSLEIESDIELVNATYLTDLKNIRERFLIANKQLPSILKIDLPNQEVSLSAFSNHTRNNMAIEIGTEIIEPIIGWLLGFVIINIILIFADFTGPPAWVIHGIALVIMIVASIFLTMTNDSTMLDSLRKQNQQEFQIDSNGILNQLNQSTIHFYDTYKK